jgi:hypothetical protein
MPRKDLIAKIEEFVLEQTVGLIDEAAASA